MNSFMLRLSLWITVVGFIGAGWLYGFVTQHLDGPIKLVGTSETPIVWVIPKGSNLSEVNDRLHRQKIISHPKLLSMYAIIRDKTDIQAGDYWIDSTDTARTLLAKFNSGQVIRRKLTFPEGWSFEQWLSHLNSTTQFSLESTQDVSALLDAADFKKNNPEGWFFPDTYTYTSSDSVTDILKRAHRKMQEILTKEWHDRASGLPYDSPYEALIMASIIEKETGLVMERPAIAGVFVRRLQKRMRLQTDPTVIYGMGKRFDGDIRRSDLKNYTPYNTYMINGLPPTPIAMPSAEAIHAALHPEEGSSLYFVARGDGGHYFSDTLEQHKEAVRRYQIDGRTDKYHSAPTKSE
jgi:UPF0755 protein